MWSAVFTFWAGYTYVYGIYSVGGHLMVLGAFFITVATFRDAEKNEPLMGETSMNHYAMWFVLGLIMVSPILFFIAGVYGDYQST